MRAVNEDDYPSEEARRKGRSIFDVLFVDSTGTNIFAYGSDNTIYRLDCLDNKAFKHASVIEGFFRFCITPQDEIYGTDSYRSLFLGADGSPNTQLSDRHKYIFASSIAGNGNVIAAGHDRHGIFSIFNSDDDVIYSMERIPQTNVKDQYCGIGNLFVDRLNRVWMFTPELLVLSELGEVLFLASVKDTFGVRPDSCSWPYLLGLDHHGYLWCRYRENIYALHVPLEQDSGLAPTLSSYCDLRTGLEPSIHNHQTQRG